MSCLGSPSASTMFQVHVGDTWPSWRFQLYGKTTGEKLDLTNVASVVFHAEHQQLDVSFSGACLIVQAGSGSGITDKGVVEYEPQAGDTDVAGVYDFWFVVTWAGGALGTIPAGAPLLMEVVGD